MRMREIGWRAIPGLRCLCSWRLENVKSLRDGAIHGVGGGDGEIPAGGQDIGRNGRPLAQRQGNDRAHEHILGAAGLPVDPVEDQVCAGQAETGKAGLRRRDHGN